MDNTIGRNIARLRKENGMTQDHAGRGYAAGARAADAREP